MVSEQTKKECQPYIAIDNIIGSYTGRNTQDIIAQLSVYFPNYFNYIKSSLSQTIFMFPVLEYLRCLLYSQLFDDDSSVIEYLSKKQQSPEKYYVNDDIEYLCQLASDNKLSTEHLNLAAQAGAINMFKYLKLNSVVTDPSTFNAAIAGGNEEIIQSLIDSTFVPSQNDLMTALMFRRFKIAEWIMEQYGQSIKINFLPLTLNIATEAMIIVDQIVDKIEFTNAHRGIYLPMSSIIRDCDLPIIKYAIESGFPINGEYSPISDILVTGEIEKAIALPSLGFEITNPFYIAHKVIFHRAKNSDKSLKFLIQNGLNVNEIDAEGLSLLHLAAKQSNDGAMRILLENKASVNITDSLGRTPLMCACGTHNFENVRMLVENGADIHARSRINETALFFAAGEGIKRNVEYLLSKGAEINITSTLGQTPLSLVKDMYPEIGRIIESKQ